MKSVDFAGSFAEITEDPPPSPTEPCRCLPPFSFCGFPLSCHPSCPRQGPRQSSVGLPPRLGCWLLAVPAASFSLQPLQLLGHPGVLQGGPAHSPSKPAVTAWAEDRRKWGHTHGRTI